ncbi:hypothetical protein WK13_00950 [Burkholderia ubonensis]|nr:hypothetical protein WK13_00950 [Burkholderia ubonensis]
MRKQIHDITAHLRGLVLEIVASTGIEIGIRRIVARDEIPLATGYIAEEFAAGRFIVGDANALGTRPH